jgi:hypothetical protein
VGGARKIECITQMIKAITIYKDKTLFVNLINMLAIKYVFLLLILNATVVLTEYCESQ